VEPRFLNISKSKKVCWFWLWLKKKKNQNKRLAVPIISKTSKDCGYTDLVIWYFSQVWEPGLHIWTGQCLFGGEILSFGATKKSWSLIWRTLWEKMTHCCHILRKINLKLSDLDYTF
jgi:hypothetical protein